MPGISPPIVSLPSSLDRGCGASQAVRGPRTVRAAIMRLRGGFGDSTRPDPVRT